MRRLAARLFAAPDDVGDGRVWLAEHIGEQEHRSFNRAKSFEHRKEPQGERLGQFGRFGGVGRTQQRLGQPRAYIRFALNAAPT